MKDYFLSKSKNTEFFDDSPVNFFLIVIIILCVMHSSTWVSYPTTENGENASNTSFPHYVRGVWNCNNYQSVWICVWEKLALGNHIITLTPLFSKSSIFKMFSVQKKNEKPAFSITSEKERFWKARFSWQISVDGWPFCRNKAAFSNFSSIVWTLPYISTRKLACFAKDRHRDPVI